MAITVIINHDHLSLMSTKVHDNCMVKTSKKDELIINFFFFNQH